MPLDLQSLNLISVRPENFFNEQEVDVLNVIMTNGTGFYKLTQTKIGVFTSAEIATEVAEESYVIYPDRVSVETEVEDLLYLHFEV